MKTKKPASFWVGSEWEVYADHTSGWVLAQHLYGVNPKTNTPTHSIKERFYSSLQQVAKSIADHTGCTVVSEQSWETLDAAVLALSDRLQQLTAAASASPPPA